MTLTLYKGLPHGSVLSPFLYNLLGSGMNRFVPLGCSFLQYTDYIMVYSSHHVLQTACALAQTACLSLVFFSLFRLTISSPLWKNYENLNQEYTRYCLVLFLFILVYFGRLCRYIFGIFWCILVYFLLVKMLFSFGIFWYILVYF
jgi:hypothetical protein